MLSILYSNDDISKTVGGKDNLNYHALNRTAASYTTGGQKMMVVGRKVQGPTQCWLALHRPSRGDGNLNQGKEYHLQ